MIGPAADLALAASNGVGVLCSIKDIVVNCSADAKEVYRLGLEVRY
jgi:hypothetical protein